MPPGYVFTVEDYWRWLEQIIGASGGYLSDDVLAVSVDDTCDPPLGLDVERQRLTFWEGSYLSFELSINDQLQPIDYSFHYARYDNTLVWRYDKHIGHEAEFGTDTHVHLGPDEDHREAYGEVDLEDVLTLIAEDLQERTG